MQDSTRSAEGVFAITPHDADYLGEAAQAIYVGGAGDISLTAEDHSEAIFSAVPVGTILPVRAIRVKATGTTATLLIGLL